MRDDTHHLPSRRPHPKWVFAVGAAVAIGLIVLWQHRIAWPLFLGAMLWPAVPLALRDLAAWRPRRDAASWGLR